MYAHCKAMPLLEAPQTVKYDPPVQVSLGCLVERFWSVFFYGVVMLVRVETVSIWTGGNVPRIVPRGTTVMCRV